MQNNALDASWGVKELKPSEKVDIQPLDHIEQFPKHNNIL